MLMVLLRVLDGNDHAGCHHQPEHVLLKIIQGLRHHVSKDLQQESVAGC